MNLYPENLFLNKIEAKNLGFKQILGSEIFWAKKSLVQKNLDEKKF